MQRPVTLSHTPLAPVDSGGFSQVEGQAMVEVLAGSSPLKCWVKYIRQILFLRNPV